MRPKYLITLVPILFLVTIASGQNKSPFESIGKKGKILTLSNGKYDEIIEKDSLERVGSVIVNRYSRKIERLVDEDSLRIILSTEQSRFLSVDPIANEYAELSPYQFASNRPIDGSDLDGLEYVQRNITIDYQAKKIINTTDVWHNPNQHNVHGKLGQGVMYKIITYDANLRLNRKVNFQFVGRNATDPFGLVSTEYGNYMGSTGLFQMGGDGNFTNKYDYSLPAVDAVDNFAKRHDMAYDAVNAVGANGLFSDWGTTPADEAALKRWTEFRNKYNVGDIDPCNGQKVTEDERQAAWRGKTLFSMVVADKKNAIAGFMMLNFKGEAKNLSSSKNVKYNYQLFLRKYMGQDKDGNWQRKKNMSKQDTDLNWIPIAPEKD